MDAPEVACYRLPPRDGAGRVVIGSFIWFIHDAPLFFIPD
jgi:hypothetical protein